jgi:hypothetical protein
MSTYRLVGGALGGTVCELPDDRASYRFPLPERPTLLTDDPMTLDGPRVITYNLQRWKARGDWWLLGSPGDEFATAPGVCLVGVTMRVSAGFLDADGGHDEMWVVLAAIGSEMERQMPDGARMRLPLLQCRGFDAMTFDYIITLTDPAIPDEATT